MDEFVVPNLVDVLAEWLEAGNEALGITAAQIAQSFASYIVTGLAGAFEVIFTPIFELISCPITFDFASDVALGFQGAALVIIFLIILGRGITKGIIGSATDDDMDVVRYIWRSIVPVGVIILAPTIASLVISAAANLMGYICGQASVEAFAHNMGLLLINLVGVGNEQSVASSDLVSTFVDFGGALANISASLIVALIFGIAIFWNVFALTLEILKRWIQLAMMSIVLPFTAVTTAIEDSGDIISAIKTMAGIVITIMLQILLLISASGVVALQASIGIIQTAFIFVAILAAARCLPAWIEKFTFASSVRSGGGGFGRAALVASRFIPRRG